MWQDESPVVKNVPSANPKKETNILKLEPILMVTVG